MTSRRGAPCGSTTTPGAFHRIESFRHRSPPEHGVLAVIDLTDVADLEWREVTDDIAMACGTEVNLETHVDRAKTTVSLFSMTARREVPLLAV